MTSRSRHIDEHRARLLWLGALAAISIAAVAALIAFEMPSRITLPSALGLTALVIWTGIRERRRDMEDEVGTALRHWTAKGGDGARARELQQAYADHFAGRRQLLRDSDEARLLLESAIAGFGNFIEHVREGRESLSLGGLDASAHYHRAAGRKLLADTTEDPGERRDLIEKAIADLEGFEDRYGRWPLLLPAAIALRLRCRLALDDFDEAESDQQALDRLPGIEQASPELLSTREDLGEALWRRSLDALDDEDALALRSRALAHLDAWLNQLGPGHLPARLRVARRNDEAERNDRVVRILEDALRGERASRRDQLEANRLLARAHLRRDEPQKALRFYSVLMSVPAPENPWHRDPEVLREIGRAERALAGTDEDDEDS